MRDLPLPTFATPGQRAFGSAGVVPANHSDARFRGLQVALVARTQTIAKVRPPCFGHLVTKNRKDAGGNAESGAFLLLALLHVPNRPDLVALVGYWLLDKGDLIYHYKQWPAILRGDPRSRAVFDAMGDDDLTIDLNWKDLGGLGSFDPSIKILRAGSARGDDDPDVLVVASVLRKHPWRTTGWLRLESLAALFGNHWEMADLIGMVPASVQTLIPNMQPAPPSGIVPSAPSFDSIEDDVFLHRGIIVRIGATPGRVAHASEFQPAPGRGSFGLILARPAPADTSVRVRMLATAQQLRARGVVVHGAWTIESYELVLTPEIITIPLEQFLRPIRVLPERGYHMGALDCGDAVRAMNLKIDEDGELRALTEPVTTFDAATEAAAFFTSQGWGMSPTQAMFRHEARFQIVPEYDGDLSNALVVVKNVSPGAFAALPNGRDAEPTGDRNQTYIYYFKNAAEVRANLWPAHENGWIIPEKLPGKSGRKRARAPRQHGFMVVETANDLDDAGSNWMAYTRETKTFKFALSVTMVGENLQRVEGAQPPPRGDDDPADAEFDYVHRAYVVRSQVEPWTLAAARAHFGER
jgi:hypothetical protein